MLLSFVRITSILLTISYLIKIFRGKKLNLANVAKNIIITVLWIIDELLTNHETDAVFTFTWFSIGMIIYGLSTSRYSKSEVENLEIDRRKIIDFIAEIFNFDNKQNIVAFLSKTIGGGLAISSSQGVFHLIKHAFRKKENLPSVVSNENSQDYTLIPAGGI
ncbi:MAG: hypothetical protein MHPSP_001924 [Paramarteilia canceri]